MTTEKKVRYRLSMKDGTSSVLEKVKKSVKSTSTAFGGLSQGLSEITIIGAGVSASLRNISRIGAAAVRGTVGEFVNFEKGLAEVATITDLSRAEMAKLGVETQNFARKYAVDATDAAGALYTTISAGIDSTNGGAQAFEVMGEALKFGKAALVDAGEATDVLTTVLNAYGLEATQAGNVSDALFKTIKLGKTTGEELAGSLGRVAPIAAAAGVSFDDLSTGVVMLTRAGLGTNEAVTALRELFVSIVKPTEESKKAVEELGLELFNENTLRQEGGLFKIIGELNERAGDSVGTLSTVIPSVGALTAALAAAGQQDALPEIMAEIANRTGATDAALSKMTETVGFGIDDLSSSFDVFKQRVGAALTSSDALSDGMEVATGVVDGWADSLLKGGKEGVGGFNSFIESLVKTWVPEFIDGMASLVLSVTQFGGTGRSILSGVSVIFSKLTWSVRKSFEGWQDLGFMVTNVWQRIAGNDEALAALEREYWAVQDSRAAAEEFRKEMELATAGKFDAAEAGKKVADGLQSLAEELRNAGVGAAVAGMEFDFLTDEVEQLGTVAAEVLSGGKASAAVRDFGKELALLKSEVFDYKQGMADIPTAYESWSRNIANLSRSMHEHGTTLEEQVSEWQVLRDAIVGAWATAHEGQSLSDVTGQVGQNVGKAGFEATGFEATLGRIKRLVSTIAGGVVRQVEAEGALIEEAQVLQRLSEVTGDSEKEILATKEAIRVEEEARAFATNAGLPDVESYVDLATRNHELAVQVNEEEQKRVLSIRERVAEEQRALEEYERGIESRSTTTTDAFGEIFSSWMAGQDSISNGFDDFGNGLKKNLSSAFLEPIIGADSLLNNLFGEMFSAVAALGKVMVDTVKGWFAEKAAQRALDATVGTGIHAATAIATAETSVAATALMLPTLATAATLALIASFGGAGAAAGLLEPLVATNIAFAEGMVAMAEGGRVTRPTLALVGEAGDETIIPESRTARSQELLSDLATRRPELFEFAGKSGGGGSPALGGTNITVNLTGVDFASGDDLARRVAEEVDTVIGRRVGR